MDSFSVYRCCRSCQAFCLVVLALTILLSSDVSTGQDSHRVALPDIAPSPSDPSRPAFASPKSRPTDEHEKYFEGFERRLRYQDRK